jgi:hypothetical protein
MPWTRQVTIDCRPLIDRVIVMDFTKYDAQASMVRTCLLWVACIIFYRAIVDLYRDTFV